MGTVSINGKTVTIPDGKSVSIVNNKIFVDGVEFKTDKGTVEGLTIIVQGNVEKLEVKSDNQITIQGNISGDAEIEGSLNCDSIGGNVSAGGSVNCDDIKGNVSAGGSVNCDDIGGSCSAGGSIRRG